ncbi:AMP-binding protein [Nocardia sp. NPDC049190]|uniref:AMP-binding protein n=1 Tax=Nocardia sp. NPDC049190 TaxID=3155650 RepID=UPI0033FC6B7A
MVEIEALARASEFMAEETAVVVDVVTGLAIPGEYSMIVVGGAGSTHLAVPANAVSRYIVVDPLALSSWKLLTRCVSTVHLRSPHEISRSERPVSPLLWVLVREGATVLYTTPSTFIALMNRGGLAEVAPPLRQIMYAGEPFPTAQLRRLRETLGAATRIADIYGPTETNTITCQWIGELPDDDTPVPLGRFEDGLQRIRAPQRSRLSSRAHTVQHNELHSPKTCSGSVVCSPGRMTALLFPQPPCLLPDRIGDLR